MLFLTGGSEVGKQNERPDMRYLKRIALVEPFDHSEVLYVLAELLLEQEVELWIFCQDYIERDRPEMLDAAVNIRWYTFTSEDRIRFFFERKDDLHQCQLLIWITAPPGSYAWLNRLGLKVPVVLIIHNLNTWSTPLRHLKLSGSFPRGILIDVFRLLRFVFWQLPQQQKLLYKVSAIGFPNREMQRLGNRLAVRTTTGKTLFIPFVYTSQSDRPARVGTEICVVIPGAVSGNGRDYEMVATAFKYALARLVKSVNLILLGQVKDQKCIQRFRTLENDRFKLTSFSSKVPQKLYETYLHRAHFLILPFTSYQKYGVVREKLGISKISGTVNDMIRYRIPALCSADYPLDGRIGPLVENYRTPEELADLIVEWTNELKYMSYDLVDTQLGKSFLSVRLYDDLNHLFPPASEGKSR